MTHNLKKFRDIKKSYSQSYIFFIQKRKMLLEGFFFKIGKIAMKNLGQLQCLIQVIKYNKNCRQIFFGGLNGRKIKLKRKNTMGL